ncbi:MAG TPA: vWA domain-containing protein [Polyangiales bacterium]|nr:vWA domain-containing protein [Polyangiales bacterium]
MIARPRPRKRAASVLQKLTLLLALLLTQLTRAPAHAEGVEDTFPLTDDPTDPIGIDREPEPEKTAADSGKVSVPAKTGESAKFGPEPPPLAAVAGEVITAPGGVKERSHQVEIELSAGLASIHEDLEFENSGEKPAEVMYRVAVPKDAALYSFEVCNVKGCRSGLPDPSVTRLNAYDDAVQSRAASTSMTLPAGDARLSNDARGTAIWLRAARVVRGDTLHIRVAYVAQANDHDANARIHLPARGMDARAAQLSLRVHSTDHSEFRANDLPIAVDAHVPMLFDAWSPIEIQARSASSGVHSLYWSVPCGREQCVRAYVSSSRDQPAPTEIYLAIDASPSTEGAARSRLIQAIAAILARAPAGSQVRALRFASQATQLVTKRQKASELPLSSFGPVAFEAELGAATRFEVAWQMIEQSGFASTRGKKLVVIVGDGGLTTGPAQPFDAAKRKGVQVAVVNVADRPSDLALARGAELTGGAVIDAGSEADAAARGASPEALEERIAALFQPSRGLLRIPGKRAAGAFDLRAGDSVLWEGVLPSAPGLTLGARPLPRSAPPHALAPALAAHALSLRNKRRPALVAVDRADLQVHRPDRPDGQDEPQQRGVACDRRGPAKRISGQSSDAAPVLLAQERAICALPKPKAVNDDKEPELGVGMPGSPLLSMLRQRIIPIARGCFRRDRGGRSDYQVRALFVFELADREVISATVQGKIAPELRDCLLSAVDSLAVPRFTGRVVVRYPLVTEREPLPSQIELAPETAGEIDRLTGK